MADPNHIEIDQPTGTSTTGHHWDGIKELNTPLPRWWVIMFYACIVWAFGYWVVYPAFPLISSNTTGILGYSSRANVEVDIDALRKIRAARTGAVEQATLPQIIADPALRTFALAQGKAAFGDNCAPCHGLSARGSRGFANLRDDDWLWGGSLDQIYQTIRHGIRNDDTNSRQGMMQAFGGANALLKPAEIVTVANYVRSIAGLAPRAGVNLDEGKTLFATNCAACHGDAGKGNQELGAPNLTDAIWLYGSDEATIIETITLGRGGVMPGWVTRLDGATTKSLAVYVHSLGGGQ